jgi:CheY-like chemotaxis protein
VANIVQRLLVFARQQKPDQERIDINEVIESTVALRAYETEMSNIEISLKLASGLPGIIADRGQLQQVFVNIILNAEVEMKRAHGKGSLLISTERIENIIQVSVQDDGPGIPKENLERIFDPFFTTKEVGEGTGLGLSICYGIIAEHGGRIWAESKQGKGATFIVELPVVAKAKPTEYTVPSPGEGERITKRRILVVDDELVIREYLGEILTAEGYEVDNADDADDALEKLKSDDYFLLLLDIKMRGMTGIELYKHLQETAESLAKKVIFITGDVMGEETWKFFRNTSVPYLIKPFDGDQLKEKIDSVTGQG